MTRSIPTLKAFYYLDHFHEMIVFLREHYPEIESGREGEFLRKFESLSRDARALAVRMANRQGRIFTRGSLRYKEIADSEGALAELSEAGLIRAPEERDLGSLFQGTTKVQLLKFLHESERELRGVRSLPKPALVDLALCECRYELLRESGMLTEFLIQRYSRDLDFLGFLFFGRLAEGMQAFTLRDLGILKTRSARSRFKPRYSGLEPARSAFIHASLRREIRLADGAALLALAEMIDGWPPDGRDRSIARLGARLEKENHFEEALRVFARSEIHPARERRCRILYSMGEHDKVRKILELILDDPSSDEEYLFAEDFHRLKCARKRVGRLTGLLREAPVIRIDEAFKESAERAAVHYYRSREIETHRAENQFWMALFGTLFWQELRELTPNEFDPRPTSLLDGSFAEIKADEIERKCQLIGTPAATGLIRETYGKHFGAENGLFRWRKEDEAVLVRFLETAPSAAIIAALRRIIADPKTNSRGYPDLIRFHEGRVGFIEIKAEGDQIRRHQLVQIQALAACGFEVGVVRIEWCFDRLQEYVVVDLETTGSRAEYQRITEIGAVKIRGGELVETFQTLLDPRRRIPPKISQLTGITDEMVRGQPVFGDIADDLRAFVGESILVAHNASFDYSFLKKEFERVGEHFRRPTLCTVSAMRKYFPGLKSYSLGALCREFGIELKDHHRALCDARATAGLLAMINEKRLV